MKIYFIRHGESRSNRKEILSSSPDKFNTLTELGKVQIKSVSKNFSEKVDYLFSSPLARTKQSAEIFSKYHKEIYEIMLDDRLREINYGNGVDDKSSPEMERITKAQVSGDYDARFGVTGENKREIVLRFFSFLLSLKDLPEDSVVVAFSHGRAISIIAHEVSEIIGAKKNDIHTGNGSIKEVYLDKSDFAKMYSYIYKKVKYGRRMKMIVNQPRASCFVWRSGNDFV